jgi:hypothetical protein
VNEAVAEGARHVLVDLRDHDAGTSGRRHGVVNSDAKAAKAMGVGRASAKLWLAGSTPFLGSWLQKKSSAL